MSPPARCSARRIFRLRRGYLKREEGETSFPLLFLGNIPAGGSIPFWRTRNDPTPHRHKGRDPRLPDTIGPPARSGRPERLGSRGRFRRRRRPVRLREIDPDPPDRGADEAGCGRGLASWRTRHGPAGDRRHGVSEPGPAGMALDPEKRAAAAGDRPFQTLTEGNRKTAPAGSSPSSVWKGSKTNAPPNSPAACASAPRSAARSSTSPRC